MTIRATPLDNDWMSDPNQYCSAFTDRTLNIGQNLLKSTTHGQVTKLNIVVLSVMEF